MCCCNIMAESVESGPAILNVHNNLHLIYINCIGYYSLFQKFDITSVETDNDIWKTENINCLAVCYNVLSHIKLVIPR